MQTYQFTAFRNERYAASGDIRADSPEDAKAKILEMNLHFLNFVESHDPDHFMLTGEAGEEYHLEDETPPDAERALLKEILERLSSDPMPDEELGQRIRALGIAPEWEAGTAMQAGGGAE
jgi:hypothetical protein